VYRYLSVGYTQRLADEGAVTSVGSRGDSYDTQSIIMPVCVGSPV
jgi:hypothetical protein